jgi:Macrocin-O-methyltransferase (TylF)
VALKSPMQSWKSPKMDLAAKFNWNHAIRRSVARLALKMPAASIRTLRRTSDLIDSVRWLRAHSLYPFGASFPERECIFALIAGEINHKQALYLEFGVFEGYSIRYWSKLLDNPTSMLHGFDSFEGLPENWEDDHPAGRFAKDGRPPHCPDQRVRFFKGWFNETLPGYAIPPHEELIINIDCDLYSSTRLVLDKLKDSIHVGTWLYFDEFGSWDHEGRAFRELVEGTKMEFEPIAESAGIWSAAFRRIK